MLYATLPLPGSRRSPPPRPAHSDMPAADTRPPAAGVQEYVVQVTQADDEWQVQKRYKQFHALYEKVRRRAPPLAVSLALSLSRASHAQAASPLPRHTAPGRVPRAQV